MLTRSSFVHPYLIQVMKLNNSWFSGNSEANASELLEKHEEYLFSTTCIIVAV